MAVRLGALVVLLSAASLLGEQALTDAQRQSNLDSFEYVWKTVHDKHWDAQLGGLDWQAVHDELRPKIEKAASMAEARSVMSALLARLKQTHFAVFPADVYKELDSPGETSGQTGIDVRVVDGRALVVGVDPGSPAQKRGVHAGWQIVRVDGTEVAPRIESLRKEFADSTLLDLRLARAASARLAGKAGSTVRVEFLDGNDRAVALELERGQPRGTLTKIGFLPPAYVWVEARKLPSNVGYVRFNEFSEPDMLSKAVGDVVNACRDCAGFVVDLRGNPGGIGGLAMGLAGWFVDKAGLQLGTMVMRDNKIKFVIYPRADPFRGPLAVLVDGCSASTSEIFAGGLKDIGRARIFGTRTAGAALPSMFERLPNGDGFQYAVANYISEGGKALEGLAVMPDEEVRLTRQQLLDGKDPVLDAAVAWMEKKRK